MIAFAFRPARINVKVLLILAVVAVVLVGGVFIGHRVRKRAVASQALTLGQAAFAKEDWPEAAQNLRTYLEKYPNDIDVLVQYGQALLRVRPTDSQVIGRALGAYRQLLRLDPTNIDASDTLMRLYMASRNGTELAYFAERRLAQFPGDPDGALWLARAMVLRNQPKEAKAKLRELIDACNGQATPQPACNDAAVLLASLVLGDGTEPAAEDALHWLEWAIQHDPNAPEPLVARARLLRLHPTLGGRTPAQSRDTALAELDRASQQKITNPRLHLTLCMEWLELGRADLAQAELRTAQAIDPDAHDELCLLPFSWRINVFRHAAELMIRTGQVDEGAELADEALAAFEQEQRFPALADAVRLYVVAGRVADARRCLDEYIDAAAIRDPSPTIADRIEYLNALVAQAQAKPYEVIQTLEPFVERNAASAAAWRMLADAYERTNQSGRAVDALVQYVRLQPSDIRAVTRLAQLVIRAGQPARALDLLRSAGPTDDLAVALLKLEARVIRVTQGQAISDQDQELASLSEDLAAMRRDHTDRAEVPVLQSMIAVRQGHTDLAIRQLTEAIETCPDPLPIEERLVQVHTDAGQTDLALKAAQAMCDRHPDQPVGWLAVSRLQQTQKAYADAHGTLDAGLKAVTDPAGRRQLEQNLAMLMLRHEDRQVGIDSLKALAEQNPGDIVLRTTLLTVPEIRKDTDAAQRLVDQIRGIEGDTGLMWRFQQAVLWAESSDWRARQQDVVDVLDRCIEADPRWGAPVLLLGQIHERLGQPDRAESLYRRVLARDHSQVAVADRLVQLLLQKKRFADAKDVVDKIEVTGSSQQARQVRVALGAGDLDHAIEYLKLYAEDEPEDVHARILLARLGYAQTRDLQTAMANLDDVERLAPDSLEITNARSELYELAGQHEQARAVLDERVQEDASFNAYLLRAIRLTTMGQLDAAEQDYLHLTTFDRPADAYALLGTFYSRLDRLDDAIDAWTKGLAEVPDAQALQRALVKALIRLDRPADRQRTEQLVDQLEASIPDHPDVLWARGSLLMAQGTPDATEQAQRHFRRAVELESTAVDAHVGLVNLAMRRGEYLDARDSALRALGDNPNNLRLRLAQAAAERAMGNLDLAWQLVMLVINSDASNIPACQLMVDLVLVKRDDAQLRRADTALQAALDQQPHNATLHAAHAVVLDALGQTSEAVRQLDAFCQTEYGSHDLNATLTLADLYRLQKDWPAGEQWLNRAAEIDPNSPAVLRSRMIWIASLGDTARVAAMIRTYTDQGGNDLNILKTAGLILAPSPMAEHQQHAIELFNAVLGRTPRDLDVKLKFALLLYGQGQINRAQDLYREVLQAAPENPQALNDLAWILSEHRGLYAEALQLADRGVQIAPSNRHLRDTRGAILTHMDRLADARNEFLACVKLTAPNTPERAKALLQAGRVCAKLDASDQVTTYLTEASTIDSQLRVFGQEEKAEIRQLLASVSGDGLPQP